jgi:hypothetical protein
MITLSFKHLVIDIRFKELRLSLSALPYCVQASLLEVMRRSLPHPNPAPYKGEGTRVLLSKLKIVNDNLAPPLSKGRLGGVKISASSQRACVYNLPFPRGGDKFANSLHSRENYCADGGSGIEPDARADVPVRG